MSWPPDYSQEFLNRQKRFLLTKSSSKLIAGAKAYYAENPHEFIQDWGITYDPRNASKDLPTTMPFILFPRQREFLDFLLDCLYSRESGLVEKSRDMGATWLCCAFSAWLWLFLPGSAVGWGSRKEQLVDKIGDPDSIFEKIRLIIDNLPIFLTPKGFNLREHSTYMKLINPENGSTITGEAGDNIGRGGRKLIYFKDEALDVNSRIYTPDGFKLMKEVQPGDFVLGRDGKPTKVTHINPCGQVPCYRLTFSDGSTVVASENHIWTMQKVCGKKGEEQIRTKDLLVRFRYESPGGQIQYRYRLPEILPVEWESLELTLHPYIVGVLLGDGTVTRKMGLTSTDPEIIKRANSFLPEGCLFIKKDRFYYSLISAGKPQGRKKGEARKRLEQAGIFGCNTWNKFIPDRYLYSSPEDRLELLRGLMDTDGSSYNGTSVFVSVSEKLAKGVQFLVRSLGGKASIKKTKDGGYKVYTALNQAPFALSRKIVSYGKKKQTCERSLVNIEYVGIRESKCITVEAADGLYLTEDFIPTHNSAHYERPEKIEAALGDNTDVQIDISSVNGTANIFARRRQGGQVWTPNTKLPKGITRVFIFDWRDHPAKTQEWYESRREKAEREGLLHVFAQEVDRDYAAAVEGVLVPSAWVKSAIDIHKRFPDLAWDEGLTYSALDVADEGGDMNAQSIRKGVMLTFLDKWAQGDTGQTANKAVHNSKLHKANELHYDSIGVGAGVKAETNRLAREGHDFKRLTIIPWSASASVIDPEDTVISGDPDSPKNKDMFKNLKAQAWWRLRMRFDKTHKFATQGIVYPVDEMICLPSNLPHFHELEAELSQPTYSHNSSGKIVVNKKPDGAKSPNLADSVNMAYCPWQASKRVGVWGSQKNR